MCENLRGKKLKKRSHNQKGGIDSESEIVWHEKEFDYEFVSKDPLFQHFGVRGPDKGSNTSRPQTSETNSDLDTGSENS